MKENTELNEDIDEQKKEEIKAMKEQELKDLKTKEGILIRG